MINKVWYQLLPYLGMNRCITTEWRHFLKDTLDWACHSSQPGHSLPSYTSFSVNGTLRLLQVLWLHLDLKHSSYGNPFKHPYEAFACLTTDGSWFKCLWELLDHYDVALELSSDFCLQPVRENDQTIVQAMYDAGFRGGQLQSIKVICHFLGLLHLSDLKVCDGYTLDHGIWSRQR